MSKSTLSITVRTMNGLFSQNTRTIEVPCRLPDSFDFKFNAFGGTIRAVAYLSGTNSPENATVGDVEMTHGPDVECGEMMEEIARRILATIKATLGITGPVPPGSPLPAIALAYEAEVATVKAQKEAWRALPQALHSLGFLPNEADAEGATGFMSPAIRMLAKYVEYVVEQAAAQEVK